MPENQRKQSGAPLWRHGEVVHTPQTVRRASGSPGRYDLVVIAASAGGVKALEQLLAALPADFPVPIAIVQHRTTREPNLLARVLSRHTPLVVKTAEQSEEMQPGTVYLAPPDLHLTIGGDRRLVLTDGHRIRQVLSSANPLFSSAAAAFGSRVIAVVLTGSDRDATDGVQTVKIRGASSSRRTRRPPRCLGCRAPPSRPAASTASCLWKRSPPHWCISSQL